MMSKGIKLRFREKEIKKELFRFLMACKQIESYTLQER